MPGDDPVEAKKALFCRYGVIPSLAADIAAKNPLDMDREIVAVEKGEGDKEDGPVSISGVITPDAVFLREIFGEDATSARDIREAIKGRSGALVVNINSPGGSVSEGSEIYETLKAYAAEDGNTLTTRVMGVAASAASWAFVAG